MWNAIARSNNGEREDGEELKKNYPRVIPREWRRETTVARWRAIDGACESDDRVTE